MFGCDGMFNSPTSQSVKGCLCAGGKDLREAMRERKETNKNRKGRKERVANDGLGPHQTNYKNAHTHTGKNKEEQEEARKTANKKKQKKKKQEEEEENRQRQWTTDNRGAFIFTYQLQFRILPEQP